MILKLTGSETADQLIKQLVYLRHYARRLIRSVDRQHEHRDQLKESLNTGMDSALAKEAQEELAGVEEHLVELRFAEIEIGRYLVLLCPELDKKVTREALFDALNTNRADRDTEVVRKYGDKASHILFVLDLENSASTRNDEWTEPTTQPLKWCNTMAFMHEMQTNAKFDRVIHDGANEFFNGEFGEYRERPLMERLAGRAV